MSLHLDARQRAMLQEMGVRVWWPGDDAAADSAQPASPAAGASSTRTAPATHAPVPAAQVHTPSGMPPHTATTTGPTGTNAAASRPRPSAPAPSTTPPPAPTAAPATPSTALVLHTPQSLYPQAAPAATPPRLGNAWLIVAEGQEGTDPFAGDAGLLLNNMLRALRLHQHPRVFLSVVTPQGGANAPAAATTLPCAQALTEAIASVQPSVVLVMGRMAARAALGRSDPLGRLRAQPHSVAGVPAIVTYDAPYLLRAPEAKAAAWADLCRARTLAQAPPAP